MERQVVIRSGSADVSTRERPLLLMLQCQYCASHNVRWFTPRRYAARAAVLLCMGCRRLTIVPPRAASRESERVDISTPRAA
jgi:hypothetical protein